MSNLFLWTLSSNQAISETFMTFILQFDMTSSSNCNFEKVEHSILIKPTKPKRRDTRKCHYGKKPCGIATIVKYLWPFEFLWCPCFSSILKDSPSWSIALSCLAALLCLNSSLTYNDQKGMAKSLDMHYNSSKGQKVRFWCTNLTLHLFLHK